MALASLDRFAILFWTLSILLEVVSCHLQVQPQRGSKLEQVLGKTSHIEPRVYSPAGINTSILELSPHNYRDSKFASLFTIVQFKNVDCTSSANLLMGTCYTSWDCMTGVVSRDYSNTDTTVSTDGSCQGGFGSCCTTFVGCGGYSNNNNTWLRSPGYPSTFNSGIDCEQTIIIEDDICQLRLDIEDLSLDYPDSTGTCSTDYLTVNHDRKFDKLCGVTKTNHFYLDVDYSSNSNVIFSFHTEGGTSFDRSWSIRVSKICCHSDEEVSRGCGQYYTGASTMVLVYNDSFIIVPRGCGQYYTGATGTIKGLNNEAPSSDDYILSMLNYGICVRMELGYCKNTYIEQRASAFTTICPDLFEKPGLSDEQGVGTTNAKCTPSTMILASTAPHTATYSYISPHLFKLDTTRDTTTSHKNSDAPNNGGVYHMTYSQTKC